MKFSVQTKLLVVALTGLLSAGTAQASPMVNFTLEASTTGTQGTYSSTLSSTPAPGSTLYFEVFALSAAPGTTNTNSGSKTPNGTSDTLITIPNALLTAPSGTTFASASFVNNFGTGASATISATGTNTLNYRAGETGYTESDDTLIGIIAGTVTVGNSFTGISAAEVIPVTNAGSIRIAGSPQSVTSTSEASGDPLLGYTGLSESATPEPTSLGLLGLGGLAMMRRRRTRRTVTAVN